MMRFLLGWIAGLATGWAALALGMHIAAEPRREYLGDSPYARYRRGEITRREWSEAEFGPWPEPVDRTM